MYILTSFSFPCRGDAEIIQWDGVVALLWRDNRVVTLLSTNAQPQQQDSVQRREHDGRRVDVPCPAAMALYNAYMGGVDRNDQLRQSYHVRLKCRKMYRYLFWFIFEIAAANAHILYTHYSGAARKPLKEFRLELAKGLVGDYSGKKLSGRSSTPPATLPLRHFPVRQTPAADSQGSRHRCWYCQNSRQPRRRRDTQWYCRKCRLYLCHTGDPATDCFLQHHK